MIRTHRIFVGLLLGAAFLSFSGFVAAETIPAKYGRADADGKTVWYDAKLLRLEGKGWADTESYYDRLPAKAKSTVPRAVWSHGQESAGMYTRFTTDSTSLRVRWTLRKENLAMPHMPATGVSGIDLYEKDQAGVWRFLENGRPTKVSNVAQFTLTPGREYLLYWPLYNGVKSLEFGIPRDATLASSVRSSHKPIVFYGTSITQGGCASRPGMAFPAIVGRKLDRPVINLGFSGSGKMEPALADLLAELGASVYVLDCLRNMSRTMVETRVEPFVRKLRAARPTTPIVLAEDCDFRNVTPTEKGRIVRELYDRLSEEGFKYLYFVSNENMLGTDFEGTVDGTHPNDLGMMRQAAVFVEALRPLMQAPGTPGSE